VHTNNNPTYSENSLVLSITTAGGSHVNTGLNSVQLNKWHHIAFTVSAANVYTIYIDGIAVPYTLTGTGRATTNATFPLILGVIILYRGLNANIDEVRVWSGLKRKHNLC
jgi:hypothetical protein